MAKKLTQLQRDHFSQMSKRELEEALQFNTQERDRASSMAAIVSSSAAQSKVEELDLRVEFIQECLRAKKSEKRSRKPASKLQPEEMAELLAQKLTRKQFIQFFEMLDEDGPAGPLYCAINDKCVELAPELFGGGDKA